MCFVPSASAHAALLGASPRPGSTVGGTVRTFEVLLDQRALDLHDMELTTEAGRPLAGSWAQAAPNLLRLTADEPLSTPGNYIVSYRVTVEDGDTTRSAFVFTYAPSASPPPTIPEADIMDERSLVLPVSLGALAVIGGLLVAWAFLRPGREDA